MWETRVITLSENRASTWPMMPGQNPWASFSTWAPGEVSQYVFDGHETRPIMGPRLDCQRDATTQTRLDSHTEATVAGLGDHFARALYLRRPKCTPRGTLGPK